MALLGAARHGMGGWVVDDVVVYDLADWILGCARTALDATSNGAPNRSYVSVGRPAHDDCCAGQGQLTVAFTRLWTSTEFPVPDTDPVPCGGRYLVVQFEVEIVRCVPMPDGNGNPPSAATLNQSARGMHVDARAVETGVRCCLRARIQNWQALGYQAGFEGYIDGQVPIGPEGGCGGSRLTLVVGVPDGCACE